MGGLPGDYVEKDIDMSIQYLKRAVIQDDKAAKAALAYVYYERNQTERDAEEAVKLAKELAERNNYYGQLLLGGFYDEGFGVEADEYLASYWLDLAEKNPIKTFQITFGENRE